MTLLKFVPWVRQGSTGLISTRDAGELYARAELDIHVTINTNVPGDSAVASAKLRMYGPGDVQSIDTKQIIRVEPLPNTPDFETNYFPFIEFDRPELPWMFTPAAPSAEGRLRPWICLIVVPTSQASIITSPNRPLAVIRVTNAGAQLPDLSESWAWAHAQIAGTDIDVALKSNPERTLSRLICPRRLQPRTSYMAAVVPAFNVGVAAGLGEKQDDTVVGKLGPAWTSTTQTIDLPVYYHWEFTTGEGGDFEALVTQLKRLEGSDVEGLGARNVSITDSNVGLPAIKELVPFYGALVPQGARTNVSYPFEFTIALNKQVNGILSPDLVLPPPMYGQWHAAQSKIFIKRPRGIRNVQWLYDLNLNPYLRSAASIGTQIVQEKQEELMTSAWGQVGAIAEANQLLRQGQLARDASRTQFERIAELLDETLILLTGPVHSRILGQDQDSTIQDRVDDSRIPLAMTTGAFRRMARTRGPIGKRIAKAGGGSGLLSSRLLHLTNSSLDPLVAPRKNPTGMITVDHVLKELALDKLPDFCAIGSKMLKSLAEQMMPLSTEQQAFFEAFVEHQRAMAPCPLPVEATPSLDTSSIAEAIRANLDPNKTIAAVIGDRVTAPEALDDLKPIMAAPIFPTPMYRLLAAISQDYILAGLEHLPNNSITAVKTNPAFVAAFMVGLNHEMSRELLWREFPTDQRGTYFRQFWDPATRVPAPVTPGDIEASKDITPIDQWSVTAGIESAAKNDPVPAITSQIVLLIRGELIKRYARANVYVVKGEWYKIDSTASNPIWRRRPQQTQPLERYPIFQGSLLPDVTFMGFELDPIEAIGRSVNADGNPIDDDKKEIANPLTDDRAGWFVVFQQQPTEPRFGLDEQGGSNISLWRNLGWNNVGIVNNHIQLGTALTDADPGFASTWRSANSAELASGTLQGPFRAAIHLSDLLGVRK
jgi:hypothetical protein